MKVMVYIREDDLELIDKLNLKPSELLKEAIERERQLHFKYLRKRGLKICIKQRERR